MIEKNTYFFVVIAHIDVERRHDYYLEDEIEPRHTGKQTDVEHDGPGVEGEYVGIFHQREAQHAELVAYRLRNVRFDLSRFCY